MEVVAHGVTVRQLLEVGRVTLLDVVEAQGGGTLAGGDRGRGFAGGVVGGESALLDIVRRTRSAGEARQITVGARAKGGFHPREQLAIAPGGVEQVPPDGLAVQLLLHLVEAVHRARGIGRVRQSRAGELERTGQQVVFLHASAVPLDARVRGARGQAGAAGDERLVVGDIGQSGFDLFCEPSTRREGRAEAGQVCELAGRAAGERIGQDLVVRRPWAQREHGLLRGHLLLHSELPQRAGHCVGALQFDDALAQQVQDFLRATVDGRRLVGGEHMVKAAIFANDHNDMLDRRLGVAQAARAGQIVGKLCRGGKRRSYGHLNQG